MKGRSMEDLNTSEATSDSTGVETDSQDSFDNIYDTFESEDRSEVEGTPDAQENEQDQHQDESDEKEPSGTQEEKQELDSSDWETRYKNVQAELTKKSQRLSELEKSGTVNDEIKQKVAFFDRLDQIAAQNPELKNAIMRGLGIQDPAGQQQQRQDPLSGLDEDDPVVSYVQQLEQKVARLEQGYNEYQTDRTRAEGNRELDSIIGKVRSNYESQIGKELPADFENKVLSAVAEKGISDAEVLSAYLFKDDLINAERQKIIDDRKAKANIKKTPTVNPNNMNTDDSYNPRQEFDLLWEQMNQ